MDRRRFLRTLPPVLAGGAIAGCSGGGGESGPETAVDAESNQTATQASATLRPVTTQTAGGPFGSWFANTSNYDGITDRRDQDEVTVTVGAPGNGGRLAFEPPAIAITTGTEVVWEWTGDGGEHNVVENEGEFQSRLTGEEGHTFRYRFRTPGTRLYFCVPHKSLGMRGAVVVEES